MIKTSTLKCSCGELLESDWTICPTCTKPIIKNQLTCPECGIEIKAKWKKCPKCQTQLEGWATPTGINGTNTSDNGSSQPSADTHDGPYLSLEQENASEVGYGTEIIINSGDVLDKYTIHKLLGSGGFGSVYLAEDTYLKQKVALKVVAVGQSDKAQSACEQIVHEFKLREKISDVSHIVRARDPRTCKHMNLNLVLLPMDFAEGGSFRDWLKKNKSEEDRIKNGMKIFRQSCLGVRSIHEAGLSHLDIKPENILLVDNTAKIADFGVGRYSASMFAENPEQVRRQGIGTPQYMSPEQFHAARQKDVGPASDIYSLGIVLYELLDGSLPFDGTREQLRQKHLHDTPTEIKGSFAKYWGIVSRCLAKKADNRYSDIGQLLNDLDRVAQGSSLSVDVCCPNCGHINSDISHDICEKCGSTLPDSLFHECRRCMKKLRLDTDVCPACGFHVMEYYVLQDRWARVQTLKDVEPAEALELLETILHYGAAEDEDKALELVKDLRKKQSQISSIIAEADKAIADGEPEKALKEWQKVLEIVPRHRLASSTVKELFTLIETFNDQKLKALEMMDRADFKNADKLLQNCLELIPAKQQIRKLLDECRKRSAKYFSSFNQAFSIHKEKLLITAKQHIEAALAQATKSPDALKLKSNIDGTISETKDLLDQAKEQQAHAEFSEADKFIIKIELLRSDMEDLNEFKEELPNIKKTYECAIEEAVNSRNKLDLNHAVNSVKNAIKICPASVQANKLLKDIEAAQGLANRLVNEAISAVKSAEFDNAATKIRQIDEVWPAVNGRIKLQKDLDESRDKYSKNLNAAKKAFAQKDLDVALEASKLCLSTCPKSREASELNKSIDRDRSKARKHLRDAQTYLDSADFDEGLEHVKKARDLWISIKEAPELETRIKSVSKDYRAEMVTAQKKFDKHDYTEAKAACNRALSICPDALEPERLIERIHDIEKQKELRRKNAKKIAKTTGKWSGYLIGAGVALVLVVVIALGFWRWVTGTVCPWFASNQGTMIGICVVLSFIYTMIHAGRNTYTWIDSGGGVFFIPLVLTGIIVAVCLLLAIFVFNAPWKSGTAVGLVIGVIASVICVITSFTES